MGASVFFVIAEGATAEEAFRSAVEEAQYEYGHGGYTGTIAEKTEYVTVASASMTEIEAEEFAGGLIERDDSRIRDKWGPAGCIALDNGKFCFFGWASD